jgi:hypothetical protein
MYSLQKNEQSNLFFLNTEKYTNEVEQKLKIFENNLNSISNLYASSIFVDLEEFKIFSKPIILAGKSLGIYYVSSPESEEPAFYSSHRDLPNGNNFTESEIKENDALIKAMERVKKTNKFSIVNFTKENSEIKQIVIVKFVQSKPEKNNKIKQSGFILSVIDVEKLLSLIDFEDFHPHLYEKKYNTIDQTTISFQFHDSNFYLIFNKTEDFYRLDLESALSVLFGIIFISYIVSVYIYLSLRNVNEILQSRIEEQLALAKIIQNINKPFDSIEAMLDEIIDNILSLNWLKLEKKGGVFLKKEEEDALELISKKYLSPELHSLCAVVPFGKCLCGRSAQKKEVLFSSCVNKDHEISFDGMKPHGHWSTPILESRV